MKTLFIPLVFFISVAASAQEAYKMPPLDKSPMDMIYFPANYPVLKIQDKITEPIIARVIYSRPQKDGRAIYGDLVPYNEIWRMGANEATEIEFFKEVKIGGKRLPKGRYTLYAIVNPTQWTVIVNKETDVWGAFKYDDKKDVMRINLPVEKIPEPVDAFSIQMDKSATGFNMVMAWDDIKVTLPVAIK